MNRIELKAKAKAQLGNQIFSNTWLISVIVVLITTAILGISSAVSLLLVGIVSVALAAFFKTLAREGSAKIESIFGVFSNDIGGTLLLGILHTIFIALWSLLFVIPGIVKAYAYSMAFYLKSEHPDWDWRKCLSESERLTNGHKMELFILDLSFIGWYIVGSLAFGVGTLWVSSYNQLAKINYYEELTAVSVE
ncbi:MAG: DUF975 family protein [Clostridia bacterium]|nr:DUF975 family protein [Clostridia bacterium]